MIMNHANLLKAGKKPVQTQAISSAMLDALMASSPSSDSEKCPVEDVSPVKEKRCSTSDDKKFSLKFIPLQIHKVHKRRKDDSRKSPSNRRHYYSPIKEALETIGPKNKHGGSPEKNSSMTSYRDKSPESFRNSSSSELESLRSAHKPDQDLDSGLETSRSREGYRQSPSEASGRSSVSSRKSSLSAFGSHSLTRKSEQGLDSDSDDSQNSSVYVTPEGTPFPMKSKDTEEKQHSRFKRSLSDDYPDEGHSANSSFNTSGYYTPESSPRNFNSAKRLKTRWSGSSSFSMDNSPYSSWRNKSSDSSEQKIQPELIGYQMVGDSQFCRFGQQILGLEREPMPNCPGRIGICISGQTITDLHRRVRDNFYPISDKIILMIGTNDFLRNVNVTTMCEELSSLVETLKKSASNIILLTLPPIPKLEKKNSTTHFKLLDIYNSHIRSLKSGEALRIADVSPFYITSTPLQRCRMHLFEVFFHGPAKRFDLIHLNRLGLEVIRKYILDNFL